MRRILLALAISSIAACASAQPTTGTAAFQQKVLAAEVAYEAPLSLAIAYNKRPRCTTPKMIVLCSDPGAIEQIRKANHAVMTAFGAAMDIASTPGIAENKVTAAIVVATDLIVPLQTILDSYK